MTTINIESKLDFYLKHNVNVLLEGGQGIGKSSLILNCFRKSNLKFKYFSAATMDPWVDFVGIPKEREDSEGHSYIDLIKPDFIAKDEVEAIFLDEFNRAPKKVRNAVMELIQFKSINGHKLNNLKVIWAAINPHDTEDDDYKFDVERLDPAQQDRFPVYIKLPYEINVPYFTDTYGKIITNSVTNWWNKLPDKIKKKVSPRRVDEAIKIYRLGGDLKDILPLESNVKELTGLLKTTKIREKLNKLVADNDEAASREYINNDKNLFRAEKVIEESPDLVEYFTPLLDKDKVTTYLLKDSNSIKKYLLKEKEGKFKELFDEIIKANCSKELKRAIEDKKPASACKNIIEARLENTAAVNAFVDSLCVTLLDTSYGRKKFFTDVTNYLEYFITKDQALELLELFTYAFYRTNRGTYTDKELMTSLNSLLVRAEIESHEEYLKVSLPWTISAKYVHKRLSNKKTFGKYYIYGNEI